MKIKNLSLILVAFSSMFISCDSDDQMTAVPLGSYDNGILVVNEGSFSAGTITFIGNDNTTVAQDIYAAENPGDGIGGFVQSIFFDNEKAFIISNGSNKITVVNRYTFELIDKIETGFSVPRYGVVLNGKAYVTNLATFGSLTDDFISVINLSTYQVEDTIAVNAIAEKITEQNGKLYVANGSYGEGNSVTKINPETAAIEKTITTSNSPNSFKEVNGVLYVLCSNYTTASSLVKINLATNEISNEIVLPESLGNAQNLTIENGKIYFTVGSKVFATALNATTISDLPLFTSEALTLYGFTVNDGKFYVSDAKDYASDGKVYIYAANGTLENQFTVGLIPNGFYFNN